MSSRRVLVRTLPPFVIVREYTDCEARYSNAPATVLRSDDVRYLTGAVKKKSW